MYTRTRLQATSWRDVRALAGLLAKFRQEALDYFEAIAEKKVLRMLQNADIGRVVGALRVDPDREMHWQRFFVTPRRAGGQAETQNLRANSSDCPKENVRPPTHFDSLVDDSTGKKHHCVNDVNVGNAHRTGDQSLQNLIQDQGHLDHPHPEQLRGQTSQRHMDCYLRHTLTLTSSVGNEVKDETPERAEFYAQEGASRKDSTSIMITMLRLRKNDHLGQSPSLDDRHKELCTLHRSHLY